MNRMLALPWYNVKTTYFLLGGTNACLTNRVDGLCMLCTLNKPNHGAG